MAPRIVTVLGGTGFIGQDLVPELVADGYEVHSVSRNSPRVSQDGVHWHVGDVSTAATLALVDMGTTEILIDMAVSFRESHVAIDREEAYARLRALEQLTALTHIVYVSTIDVYGSNRGLEVTEDAVPSPGTPYAQTKYAHEEAYAAFAQDRGIPLTILRLAQVYGKGDTSQKAIPTFIAHARNNKEIVVHGSGEERRKYVHVSDVSLAVRCAIKSGYDGCINVAGSETVSLREVIGYIQEVLGTSVPVTYASGPVGDTTTLSIRKAEQCIGYMPRVTMRKGIALTV